MLRRGHPPPALQEGEPPPCPCGQPPSPSAALAPHRGRGNGWEPRLGFTHIIQPKTSVVLLLTCSKCLGNQQPNSSCGTRESDVA